ncbi:MAG: flagellar motor protein MotB [Phycisphaeraceae bacterium]
MARRPKKPEEGASAWVVTYGDMMSLLLVFFIMLFALSEIKKEDHFDVFVEAVREAFGARGGGGKLPTEDDPKLSLIEVLEALQHEQQGGESDRSAADDPGMEGRDIQVTTVREGLRFVVGGRITFEPGSADLSEQARRQLRQVARELRGYNNLIELRGHADAGETREPGSRYGDLWSLSYGRARAVMQYLTGEDVGIRTERVRLVSNADREPLVRRVQGAAQRAPNRRVEVVVLEALVEDFAEPETVTGR